MAIVVGIKFRTGSKVYYFDPIGIDFTDSDHAVVETSRGIEYGKVAFANKEVSDKEIVPPLKPVLRKATPADDARHEKNLSERGELIASATEKCLEHGLSMKVADAEYTLDRSKVIIHFTADGRVDFRDLVKDLANVFRVRIELRQIYERDEIKLRGALGSCGRPCCCITHLNDYDKVTIKMAKLQGLSLSPQKISGCCGKLMCCLRYEHPYYQEMFKKMPKINSKADTPDGMGIVISHDILKQQVKVKIEGKDGSYEFKTYPLDKVGAKQKQSEDD
ncbi:MAG: stage 0 sporulation protein [Firmicutes bacterium]|nr:stage 0 sporulation protein [Bacillota bacterium]